MREALDVDWLDVLFACDEVERCVRLVEERLRLKGFEDDDFKASRAAYAEFGPEEVY